MTNKWTVNGVEAPEGAELYANGVFWRSCEDGTLGVANVSGRWYRTEIKINDMCAFFDYQERQKKLSRIDIASTNGNDGEHYSDYACCLSEAINKLKHCADVAPDDKRKDALLEIVDEVEFIKSEGGR